MTALFIAWSLLAAGAVAALLARRWWRVTHAIGASSALAGSGFGMAASITMLRAPAHVTTVLTGFPVLGDWSVLQDATAGVFLLATFLVSGAAALFATGYLDEHTGGRLRGWVWPCFNVMVLGITGALLANSALLFLLAFELLTIASGLLVIVDYQKLESRKAAWLYFLASHAGTACLIAFFALNYHSPRLLAISTGAPAWLIVLPLIGFGIKAGIVPLHVWLPEAHPAAPSHVSAVMSGAMVSVGIYGMFRVLHSVSVGVQFGAGLILLGGLSAIAGAVQALASRRVKRLLAYSTVENSGIMLLGMGLSAVATAVGQQTVAVLASVAVLAHVLVHAAFKGTLFLGAGVMIHAAHTDELDEMSGLAARAPATASAMLVASATAVATPPFGAFVSEFLLYLAAIRFLNAAPVETVWLAIVLIVALALSGACALAAFVKLYATPFLGRARTHREHGPSEWRGAKLAYLLLGAACLAFGVAPWLLVAPALRAVEPSAHALLAPPVSALMRVNAAIVVALLVVGTALWLARRQRVRRTATWGCGFTQPIATAQYTGTSLVQPLTSLFQPVGVAPHDPFMKRVYRPGSAIISFGAAKMRRIQHGRLHWYLLYIFGALALALLIEFWGGR